MSFNKHSGNQCEKGARQRIKGRIVDVPIDRLLMDGDEMAFHRWRLWSVRGLRVRKAGNYSLLSRRRPNLDTRWMEVDG